MTMLTTTVTVTTQTIMRIMMAIRSLLLELPHDVRVQADCTVLTEGAVQKGAIHRKQRCCNKHAPTVHDAEHVLECSKTNSDWFKRIREEDALWSGSSEAARQQRKQRGSSEAARCRAGSM